MVKIELSEEAFRFMGFLVALGEAAYLATGGDELDEDPVLAKGAGLVLAALTTIAPVGTPEHLKLQTEIHKQVRPRTATQSEV